MSLPVHDKSLTAVVRLQEEMISRLAAGTRGGRAASAKIELERLKAPGSLVEKPFEAKRRTFSFPPVERMGQEVLSIKGLTHGYRDRLLFKNATCTIEKGERVAIIGKLPPCGVCPASHWIHRPRIFLQFWTFAVLSACPGQS